MKEEDGMDCTSVPLVPHAEAPKIVLQHNEVGLMIPVTLLHMLPDNKVERKVVQVEVEGGGAVMPVMLMLQVVLRKVRALMVKVDGDKEVRTPEAHALEMAEQQTNLLDKMPVHNELDKITFTVLPHVAGLVIIA